MERLDVKIVKKDKLLNFNNMLGVIEYGEKRKLYLKENYSLIPYQFVQVKKIPQNLYEIWRTCEPISYKKSWDCSMAQSNNFSFHMTTMNDMNGLHLKNAESAYNQILNNLDLKKYCIVRFWNYISDINDKGNNLDRYREFCVGREKAFSQLNYKDKGAYPAATGIGIKGNNLCIYFLAISNKMFHCSIENPRQTPAYAYPEKYGDSSPKFSRASFINTGEQMIWLVSGTASIINAETIYENNVVKQTETTIENIEILLSYKNLKKYTVDSPDIRKDLKCLKVYIRDWKDFSTIQKLCEGKFDKEKIVYMQNDICRSNLLVELEGVWMKQAKRSF